MNSSASVSRPGGVSQTGTSHLEVLDEFPVIKLGGGAVVGLRQGQVEPHRRPLLGSSLLPVAGFAEPTVAGSPPCPGRCLDLPGCTEVEVGLLLQPAFPRLRGCSSCEGREDADSEEKSYFAKLLQIGGLKRVSRSSGGCSVPRRIKIIENCDAMLNTLSEVVDNQVESGLWDHIDQRRQHLQRPLTTTEHHLQYTGERFSVWKGGTSVPRAPTQTHQRAHSLSLRRAYQVVSDKLLSKLKGAGGDVD
ncbi:hypothetical protein EYF80_006213 [Liparis tanakae]|uniref:Uncharacterized protein n=1 Tax=Liparis tanakae TaxID=230148 RepID=A0A4Z2J039_9TELE|nr:hypothetical protein EYF80_006213 [Liparis tanakae]